MTAGPVGLGRLFFKNLTAVSVVQAANMIAPLLIYPYLLRVLGAEGFGRFALAQGAVGYVTILVEFGFNLSAARTIARARAEGRPIVDFAWSVTGAKVLLLAIGAVLLLAVTSAVGPLRAVRPLMVAFLPIAAGSLVFPEWLFRGLERMAAPAAAILVARAGSILAIVLMVRRPGDVWLAALAMALTPWLAGVLCIPALRRGSGAPGASWRGVGQALAEGWDTFLSTAAVSLYSVSNGVVLGVIAGPAPLAFFATADKIRTAAAPFSAPATTAAYPRAVAVTAGSREAGLKLAGAVARPLAVLGLAVGAALFIFAPTLVRLVAGPGFDQAITPLRIMAALPVVLALNSVLGILVLLPRGRTRLFSRILMAGGIGNLLLLVPLVWRFGATGAAAALTVTETAITLAMAFAVFAPAAGGSDAV